MESLTEFSSKILFLGGNPVKVKCEKGGELWA
jgi:hypothetical protein